MVKGDGPSGNEVATARRTDAVSLPEGPRLLVICGETARVVPIPAHGLLKIGRADDADVVVDDIEMSRVHLAVSVTKDGSLSVSDERSSNGTVVRGERIAPGASVPFGPGDVIEAGRTRILLLPTGAMTRRRRVWPHGYFELRVEEACTRSGGIFTVLRLSTRATKTEFERVVSTLLGAEDVVASFSPEEYEVMLSGASPADADRWLERLCRELPGTAPRGRASFPQDTRDPDSLLARCGPAGVSADPDRPLIVGDDRMREIHAFIERIAPGDIGVLLMGETGVGKEVVVERLHALSRRRDAPLLRLNCGGLTENLLESELFGHEKGAFTGAIAAKPGLLETAEHGTVFLDEVGEMPLPIQAKLLRVLEERKVRRVGGLEAKPIDVRFIAATNRDLERMSADGAFRSDLYYRLNGVTVVIPPLRERRAEILPLARGFLAAAAKRNHAAASPDISPKAAALLETYGWPGNIRELRNVMERAWLLSAGATIDIEHLPAEKLASRLLPSRSAALPPPANAREARHREILAALESCAGNQTRAAKKLGVSRKTLMIWLDDFGIARPKKSRDDEGDE